MSAPLSVLVLGRRPLDGRKGRRKMSVKNSVLLESKRMDNMFLDIMCACVIVGIYFVLL